MHSFAFADRDFLALPERALFWPERRALLVADLHLEKASWFAARGQMLPPFDSAATLTKLLALAARTDAQEIWALGDSFHDDAGPDRLDDDVLREPEDEQPRQIGVPPVAVGRAEDRRVDRRGAAASGCDL